MLLCVGVAFVFEIIIQAVISSSSTVTTSTGLQSALNSASPGDVITLGPQTFIGAFNMTKRGSPNKRIQIKGTDSNTVLSNKNTGIGLTISGDYIDVNGISIKNYTTGLLVVGKNNTFQGLMLDGVQTGVIFQGTGNTLSGTTMRSSPIGVNITADNNQVISTTFQNSDMGIVMGKNACCGEIKSNTVQTGGFRIDGNRTTLESNTVKGTVIINGCDNSIQGQISPKPTYGRSCTNPDMGSNIWQ